MIQPQLKSIVQKIIIVMIKINILITFTKFLAILVLVVGGLFAFLNKDAQVMIFTISLSAGLTGLKTWSEGLVKRKEIQSNSTYDPNA